MPVRLPVGCHSISGVGSARREVVALRVAPVSCAALNYSCFVLLSRCVSYEGELLVAGAGAWSLLWITRVD